MRHELKKARQRAGLTQAQLAAIAGIDRSTYAHIELGDRDPSFDAACQIAARLSKRVEDLFVPVSVLKQPNQKEASTNA